MGLDKFSAAMDLLKGFHVNLFVGENVYKGKLIGVETDHVVLETDDKYIFYYNIEKIQAITKNTRQFQPDVSSVEFQKTQSLKSLLHSFQHAWVTILAFNKQKFTGVLSEIDEDFVTLINGEERILIKVEHVSNILKGVLKEESKQENTNENNKSSVESKNKNHNKNEKSDKDEKTDKCEKSGEDEIAVKDKNQTYPETEIYTKHQSKTSSHNGSEKESKTDEKMHEIAAAEEKVVWSQPIKADVINITHKTKKASTEEKIPKMTNEPKKPQNDMMHNDKKNDECKNSKSNCVEPKEMKKEKETAPLFKMEPKPTPLLHMPKKEAKPVKTQENANAAKPVMSTSKKGENTAQEANTNDTKSVWKQKDKETQAFRFAGEPVRRDEIKAFPFAGWPNRSKRTFRF